MKLLHTLLFILALMLSCNAQKVSSINNEADSSLSSTTISNQPINNIERLVLGAERLNAYISLLTNQNVALLVNQTSVVGSNSTHLVDTLLSLGVAVKKVFAPEHGFRGTADAGEQVNDGTDIKTGLPIISLYGKNKKPTAEQLANIDVVIFDIQDVGARFYTYISSMHYVMEACAENDKAFIVLDRPNPNGHYVDGPVLDKKYQSFVGMHPIPIVHGLTVGELARMINGEGWLTGGVNCELTVISCQGYHHQYFYSLPIKPSPNLPNIRSIYLYPSLCLFEGTTVSVGRGTDLQFQVIGHPALAMGSFAFTPVSMPGAKYPKHENKNCYGTNLSGLPLATLRQQKQLNLSYLLGYYQQLKDKHLFFLENNFFDKLAGNNTLQQQIKVGKTEEEIRASWQVNLQQYKQMRKRYLLYEDFE